MAALSSDDVSKTRPSFAKCCSASLKYCKDRLPIITWLPQYRFSEYLFPDVLAGVTLGCLHIPQGLAFGLLSRASPICGLYTSCFAVFVYCFFGNAHVSSVGPVAIASILTGDAISPFKVEGDSADKLVVTVTFLVGLIYVAAFFFKFGALTVIFTKALKTSFILACSITIMVKSLTMVLGLKIAERGGYFSMPLNFYKICQNIPDTNLVTFGLSLSIIILFLVNLFAVKPLMSKYTKVAFPIEAFAMILAILVSYLLNLKQYDVVIVGDVPSGLPEVTLPKYEIITNLWASSLVIAITNFSTSITMMMIFNEGLDPQQELFALGVTNILCCHLKCLPFGNSMMRTAVAQTLGIKTLVSGFVTSLFVLIVLGFAGPLFSPLPKAVLGCIILFGIGLLLPSLCKQSLEVLRSDIGNIFIWVIVFTVGLFIDVTIGLFVGLVFTLRQNLASQLPPPLKKSSTDQSKSLEQPPESEELLDKKEKKNPANK